MKIAILKITTNRIDLTKPVKTEIVRIEEVSEESYFSTLVEVAFEELSSQF